MTRYRKNAKHPVIQTGLYAHYEKWKIDWRTTPGRLIKRGKAGLAELFPHGVSAAAALLIDRVVYKALKLSIFETMDLKGAELGAGAHQRYLNMANSLREDLRLLSAMAQKPPRDDEETLPQYLARKAQEAKAAKALPIKGEDAE
jgi:hypothetical protein